MNKQRSVPVELLNAVASAIKRAHSTGKTKLTLSALKDFGGPRETKTGSVLRQWREELLARLSGLQLQYTPRDGYRAPFITIKKEQP